MQDASAMLAECFGGFPNIAIAGSFVFFVGMCWAFRDAFSRNFVKQ